ncbi:hypothetical protein [Lysobacter arvi]|uniref:Uncharacterized protein n=1 Tax=Lysobacter arvi TaxID=3038776 RepID=A0ABU1CFN7_9GAMM|nr:hypothetical protein [Lysobacter arvi]MDR0183743.1 hypothetical protein [Lysobacter arvi]
MNLFTGLLFNQGYIQDADLALSLARVPADPEREASHRREREARLERRRRRASFHAHAVSSVCGTTALSPFR